MPAGRAFTDGQAREIEQALRTARQETGLRFSVWLGATTGESRTYARRLHAALGREAPDTVLIAVDPIGRRLEIVTGEDARQRLDDRACALVAMSMTAAFSVGDLLGGLTSGLSLLTNHARQVPIHHEHATD